MLWTLLPLFWLGPALLLMAAGLIVAGSPRIQPTPGENRMGWAGTLVGLGVGWGLGFILGGIAMLQNPHVTVDAPNASADTCADSTP